MTVSGKQRRRSMNKGKMTAKKELRNIIILYHAKEEFAICLSMGIALSFLLAYIYRDRDNFLCSLFLNIAGGLITGLIITLWFRLNDKILERLQQQKKEMSNKLEIYKIKEFCLSKWVYMGYPYEDYEELSHYTEMIKKFLQAQLDCINMVVNTLEYYQNSKDIRVLGKKLLDSIISATGVFEGYEISDISFTDPNCADAEEMTLLDPIPLLYKGDTLIEKKDEYISLIKLIENINIQIDDYNSLLVKEKEKYKKNRMLA